MAIFLVTKTFFPWDLVFTTHYNMTAAWQFSIKVNFYWCSNNICHVISKPEILASADFQRCVHTLQEARKFFASPVQGECMGYRCRQTLCISLQGRDLQVTSLTTKRSCKMWVRKGFLCLHAALFIRSEEPSGFTFVNWICLQLFNTQQCVLHTITFPQLSSILLFPLSLQITFLNLLYKM